MSTPVKPGAVTGDSEIDHCWNIPKGEQSCPITGRPFFQNIEHEDLGRVATYGGPFDSYTIPRMDDDGWLRCERFDHDRDEWIEGGEPAGHWSQEQGYTHEEYRAAIARAESAEAQRDALAELVRDTEADRQDAERYRALRKPPKDGEMPCVWWTTDDGDLSRQGEHVGPMTGDTLDSAVNVAICALESERRAALAEGAKK